MAHPLLSPTFPNLRIDAVWVPSSPKCGTLCKCQRELPLKTSQNSRTSELACTVAKGHPLHFYGCFPRYSPPQNGGYVWSRHLWRWRRRWEHGEGVATGERTTSPPPPFLCCGPFSCMFCLGRPFWSCSVCSLSQSRYLLFVFFDHLHSQHRSRHPSVNVPEAPETNEPRSFISRLRMGT